MDLWCRKGKTYSGRSVAEGRCRFSGQVQVDAAAKVDGDEVRCGGGGGARVTDGGERTKTKKGKNEEDLVGSIYKEGPLKEREKQGGQKHKLSNCKDASIFEMVIKIKIHWDTLKKMCIYGRWHHAGLQKSRGWRHGGLRKFHKVRRLFLSVEDWHEPVQINLGPNVGDIIIGITRLGGAELYLQIFLKPKTKHRDGGSVTAQIPEAT